jgi:hypothetical protein
MKTFLFCLCFLSCFVQADESLPAYLVIAPEGMDDAIVNRVQGWMQTNLYYEVKVKRLPEWEGDTGQEQIEAVMAKAGNPGMVTVILAPELPENQHAFLVPDQRVGIVNVGLLAPEVNEKTLRRLDRQAIRIVGFSLGISPQPIPFCALYPYKSMQELDSIGRGFSPPAMALYRQQLEKNNIPLSPEAKKYLPNVTVKMPAPPAPPSSKE